MTREQIKTELHEYWGVTFDSLLLEEFMVHLQERCDLPLSEYNEFELASDFEYVLDLMEDDSNAARYEIF